MVDNKEEKVKSAAAKLFARYGLRKTTMEEIAKAAGVAKGTVYLYFENKDELFADVVRREAGELMHKIRKAVAREETASGQLRAYFRTLSREIERYVVMYSITSSAMEEIWPAAERVADDLGRDRRAILAAILDRGVEREELAIEDTELASHALDSLLAALREPWIRSGRDLGMTKKADALLSLLLDGMARRPAATRKSPR